MIRDVFTRYLKECLLEVKQILANVSNLRRSLQLATRDKIEPLGFQRLGLESKQPGVTWFRHLVVLFGTKKC
jgi:hypothetical protein